MPRDTPHASLSRGHACMLVHLVPPFNRPVDLWLVHPSKPPSPLAFPLCPYLLRSVARRTSRLTELRHSDLSISQSKNKDYSSSGQRERAGTKSDEHRKGRKEDMALSGETSLQCITRYLSDVLMCPLARPCPLLAIPFAFCPRCRGRFGMWWRAKSTSAATALRTTDEKGGAVGPEYQLCGLESEHAFGLMPILFLMLSYLSIDIYQIQTHG